MYSNTGRLIRAIGAYLAVALANIRFFVGDILGNSTTSLTIVITLVLLCTIDFKHFRYYHYIIVFCGTILSSVNPNLLPITLLFFISIACKDISIKKMALMCLILQLLFLFYMYWMIVIGDIQVHKVNYEKAVTYDFGFGNSNTFAMFMFSIILCFYVACCHLKSIFLLSCILILSYFVYDYAVGRTVFAAELILVITALINIIGGKTFFLKIKTLLAFSPIIIILICIYIVFNFLDYDILNNLLTGRIGLWVEYFMAYVNQNIWIGADVVSIVDKPLDNSFLTLLVFLGIIGYCLYSYLIYKGIKCGYNYLYQYIPFIISIFLCGLTENILPSYYPANIIFFLLMYKGAFKNNQNICYCQS